MIVSGKNNPMCVKGREGVNRKILKYNNLQKLLLNSCRKHFFQSKKGGGHWPSSLLMIDEIISLSFKTLHCYKIGWQNCSLSVVDYMVNEQTDICLNIGKW